jgi:hypothetical protein
MKRELAALALLLLLVVGAWWNVQTVDQLTDSIRRDLLQSQQAVAQGDYPTAERLLQQGLARFVKAAPYTQVFIRHDEIDSCMDAFYDYAATLCEEESPEALAACEKLLYHLQGIDSMEHPLPGSIF